MKYFLKLAILYTPLLAFMHGAFAEVIATVVSVESGDELTVKDHSGERYQVRLAGIDAPEPGQAYHGRSAEHLARLLNGREILIEPTEPADKECMTGKVWVKPRDCPSCGKTLNVNHAQILGGQAWLHREQAELLTAEDKGRYTSAEGDARARRTGLWSDENPVYPGDWRLGIR